MRILAGGGDRRQAPVRAYFVRQIYARAPQTFQDRPGVVDHATKSDIENAQKLPASVVDGSVAEFYVVQQSTNTGITVRFQRLLVTP